MAGQIYGKLDCIASTVSEFISAQEIFKSLYDFMVYLESEGVVTLRARYAGDSAVSAAAVDYHDGPAPFRNNAWFLYEWRTATTTPPNPNYAGTRTFPWYLFVQMYRGDQGGSFGGTGAGSPSLLAAGNPTTSFGSIGVQAAIGVGGTGNPWNGTLGTYGSPSSFGNQTKGTPVWANPPGGGTDVFVFPRQNNPGGTYNTNKQNCARLFNETTAATSKYSFLADHDSFLSLTDQLNTNAYNMMFNGVYTLRQGLSLTYPFVQFASGIPLSAASRYGSITTLNEGGIVSQGYSSSFTSTGVLSVAPTRLTELMTSTYQPSTLSGANVYDEMPLAIGVDEIGRGHVGYIEFFKEIVNIAAPDVSTAGDRAVFQGSSATTASIKISVPWKPGITPHTGSTRTGTTTTIP